MALDAPLYPERSGWWRGDHPEALHVLTQWVGGRTFHPYGVPAWDRPEYERDNPPMLECGGELQTGIGGGHVSWWITCRQYGIDGLHSCSGYSDPNHAAYVILSGIEEVEREVYEEALVVGVA